MSHAAAALAKAGFPDPTLVLRWPEVAGHDIERLVKPLKWQEGRDGAVLTLKCEPGAVVFLQHETRALLERLNCYLGERRVGRIKLVASPLAAAPPLPPHPLSANGHRPPPALSPATLAEALAALSELRCRQKASQKR